MVETEKIYQIDEKKFNEQNLKCEKLKNRIEEIIESIEGYNSTLYILNKEFVKTNFKTLLVSMSTSFSSPIKTTPSKFITKIFRKAI